MYKHTYILHIHFHTNLLLTNFISSIFLTFVCYYYFNFKRILPKYIYIIDGVKRDMKCFCASISLVRKYMWAILRSAVRKSTKPSFALHSL